MIDGEHVPHCTAAKAVEVINSKIENDNPGHTDNADKERIGAA
jgi:hypothetical protein